MAEIAAGTDPNLIPRLRRVLAGGGVVIMPCDTIYGIVGAAPQAEARIRVIKNRKEDKPFIHLIPDVSWLSALTPMPLPESLRRYWPGPLTIVFPALEAGTVAIRLPRDEQLRALIRDVGGPLYSTSVNKSGQPALHTVRAIVGQFGHLVDLIVDGGDEPEVLPSTVVDVTAAPYRILRRGAIEIPAAGLRPGSPPQL